MHSPMPSPTQLRIKLQLHKGDDVAIGPGKAALLAAIGDTGSISAAARATGMSYRRAWQLVETCNRCFAQPLVETRPGAGARLTAQGQAVLNAYRRLQAAAERLSTHPACAELAEMLADRA